MHIIWCIWYAAYPRQVFTWDQEQKNIAPTRTDPCVDTWSKTWKWNDSLFPFEWTLYLTHSQSESKFGIFIPTISTSFLDMKIRVYQKTITNFLFKFWLRTQFVPDWVVIPAAYLKLKFGLPIIFCPTICVQEQFWVLQPFLIPCEITL